MTEPTYNEPQGPSYLTAVAVAASIMLFGVFCIGEPTRREKQGNGTRERWMDPCSDGHGGDRRDRDSGGVRAGAASGLDGEGAQGVLPASSAQVPGHSSGIHGRNAGETVPAHTRRTFNVSAYCPCWKCCGPRACGVTASGKSVMANGGAFVAADRAIPFNTRIIIPGYNGGRAAPVYDRGGKIKGNRLDVYFPTHRAALNWGRKSLTCEVLK